MVQGLLRPPAMGGRLLLPALTGLAFAVGAGCASKSQQGDGGQAGTGAAGTTGTAGATGNAGTGGAGGRGGGGGGTGGNVAGTSGHDECQSDADCPKSVCSSPPCSELLCALGNDGFHHCTPRTPPALVVCPEAGATDCCDSDAKCTAMSGGHCIPSYLGYCGGAAPLPINECRYDACTRDDDCTVRARGVCTVGYPRVCLYGACRTNQDCTSGPNGRCVLAIVGGTYCQGEAVFCRYSTDPCASNGDCPGRGLGFGQACVPRTDGQGTMCQDVPPPPP